MGVNGGERESSIEACLERERLKAERKREGASCWGQCFDFYICFACFLC